MAVVIIMAGGLGKRMGSSLPKVLHILNGKPMLQMVIESVRKISPPSKILVVVGQYKDQIRQCLSEYGDITDIQFVYQEKPLGTGHAVLCCQEYLKNEPNDTRVLVLSGDIPLISFETIREISQCQVCKIMTAIFPDPAGYGRIIESAGKISIVEEKDCTNAQREIQKVNCGIYSFRNDILLNYLPRVQNNNAQSEYYLTDIVQLIATDHDIEIYNIPQDRISEAKGVNTLQQLEELRNE